MKKNKKYYLFGFICIFLFTFFINTTFAANGKVSDLDDSSRFVSMDFNNVDINVFIKFISELTSRNFIIDHRVKGKVTIISPAKISVKEAYKVFESVLEVYGYTTVKAGDVIKILPSPDARSKNIETLIKMHAKSPEDKLVTQLVPLKYGDPVEIKRLLAPLVSKSSVILAYPPTNNLIITDMYSNITRLLKIIKAIDISGVGQELTVIPLKFSDALKVEKLLNSVFKQTRSSRKNDITKVVKFVADERTNTIIILSSLDQTLKIKKLIKLLDKETPHGNEGIQVYYLENAMAENLAKVLQKLPSKKTSSAKGKKTPLISADVNISPDKATNSLIIMSNKEDYKVIEDIIKKLDIPRSMVFIECLIMEVNVDSSFNLGAEWAAMGKGSHDGTNGGYGGGFGGGDSFGSLTNLITKGALPSGFSLGLFSELIEIGGVKFPNLALMVKAFKTNKDIHIVSTPQILTMDNEEAEIYVGRNMPYLTRTGTTSALPSDVYQTYEYKDVGLTLKITPHISKDRRVRLKISQIYSNLDTSATSQEIDRPTTYKRTIDTTVMVNDKHTLVIGGLIDDQVRNSKDKVPCLGDIPIIRWFFSSIGKGRVKTNLFIFLTPRVIENPEEANTVYKSKRNQIDKIKEGQIKLYDDTSK